MSKSKIIQPEVKDVSYHKSIDNLPLNKFIDCLVDNNLSALTISGFPTEQQLTEAWAVIINQYTDIIGSHEYKMYVSMFKEVALLKLTLQQINIIIAKEDKEKGIKPGILRLGYDEFFAGEINRLLGTSCRFNWNDQKSYYAELDKCVNRSKAIKIQLDLKLLKFEAIEKKNTQSAVTKIDRQYFVSILITLSDHAKYPILDNIKMSEYCERIKRFNIYCEQLKKS